MSVVANVAINVDAANAIQQLNRVKTAATDVQGGFNAASKGAAGLGTALQAALGPLLTITTALAAVKAGLDTAFERGAAEQRLRNLTSSTGEFNAAMALAADSASKFGLTQTDTTKALADVYGRLKGVGFGLQETGQIYQGFNAIALQSGLAGEEAAGAFFQLSQALGKGKLNGDEFVIVAERMPQLLDAIAQTTGRSRGELTQMAQDGKITSQVLYEALSGAAGASEGLNDKLTQQQQTFNNLRQVTDQLLNSIGQVFGPVVVAGAEGLAKAGQMLADWWGYVGNVIFPKVYEALQPVITSLKAAFEDIDFDAVRVAIQSILIQGFEIAIGVIGNFSKVLATVIDGFKALSQNPVFQFIAEQVGRLAGFLGISNDKVKEFKDEQNKVTQASAESVKQYSSLPPKIDDAKEAGKKLKEEQQAVTKAIQEASKAADELASRLATNIDNQLKITQARFEAEKAINDVLLQQSQRQLDAATSQKEREIISQRIYDLTVRNAEIELKSTQATIAAEVEKARIALSTAQLKERELTAIVQMAIATKTVTQAHYDALKAQRGAVELAYENLKTTREVAESQYKVADAVYRSKVEAAEAAFQQNIVAKNTQGAAQAASSYANEMERGAAATKQAAQASEDLKNQAQGFSISFGEAGKNAAFTKAFSDEIKALNKQVLSVTTAQTKYNEVLRKYLDLAQDYNRIKAKEKLNKAQEEFESVVGKPVFFAKGGYVTRPTNAVIGEGGQPEYVIPSSKMDQAMANYAAGRRGSQVLSPQVNITTGPVTQMDGTNYVTMSDLRQATSAAARQGANLALSQLQTNPSLRRSIGVAR